MKNSKIQCTCPKTACERYGNCIECEAFHGSKGKLPHCKRKKWHIKPLIFNSLVLFVFALFWNGLVHLVILKNQNVLLASIHRADLYDKMWISLMLLFLFPYFLLYPKFVNKFHLLPHTGDIKNYILNLFFLYANQYQTPLNH